MTTPCAHHWMLATAAEDSPAVCKLCGAERTFVPLGELTTLGRPFRVVTRTAPKQQPHPRKKKETRP